MLRCGFLRGLSSLGFVALRLHDLLPSGFVGDGSCRHRRKPREAKVLRGGGCRVLVGA